jgi:hypothetical protein
MGVPTRRMNQQLMHHLIAAHTEPDGYVVPYLIRAKQKTLHVPDGIRLDAIECRYVHQAREDGLSDHSAMLADVVSMEGSLASSGPTGAKHGYVGELLLGSGHRDLIAGLNCHRCPQAVFRVGEAPEVDEVDAHAPQRGRLDDGFEIRQRQQVLEAVQRTLVVATVAVGVAGLQQEGRALRLHLSSEQQPAQCLRVLPLPDEQEAESEAGGWVDRAQHMNSSMSQARR